MTLVKRPEDIGTGSETVKGRLIQQSGIKIHTRITDTKPAVPVAQVHRYVQPRFHHQVLIVAQPEPLYMTDPLLHRHSTGMRMLYHLVIKPGLHFDLQRKGLFGDGTHYQRVT